MRIGINKDKYLIYGDIKDRTPVEYKIIDSLPADAGQYFYKYSMGNLIKAEKRVTIEDNSLSELNSLKEKKFKELEEYYNGIKDYGFIFHDKHFKADDEAYNNFVGTAVLMSNEALAQASLPLTWYTRNGEEGVIVLENIEEVMNFIGIGAMTCKTIKDNYYSDKKKIEECITVDELNSIVFMMNNAEVEENGD